MKETQAIEDEEKTRAKLGGRQQEQVEGIRYLPSIQWQVQVEGGRWARVGGRWARTGCRWKMGKSR